MQGIRISDVARAIGCMDSGQTQEFSVVLDGVMFPIFVRRHPGSKWVVFGQGAVDRNRSQLPVFQRKTWVEDICASCVIVSDPTLALDPTMRLGWFQGDGTRFYLAELASVVAEVTGFPMNERADDLCFYGSSAGGFTSLFLARYFPGSCVIVNNPQTDVLEYHEGPVNKLLRVCYPGLSREQVRVRFQDRLSVRHHYLRDQCVHYFQNVADTFHYEVHYRPFVQGYPQGTVKRGPLTGPAPRGSMVCYEYNEPTQGHNPLDRRCTTVLINSILQDQPISLDLLPFVHSD
ncbi:hypothetical protein J2Z79_001269 [Symbiobacterium terraclitae]|uniref:Glycosyl transferase n=1 Tax=Symbiobacterium terraclitae TaxID=557451 RepID=A0ABS4JQS5_9FIRM|nr:hypothetical protein [Symbiobacterium terraclitae]